MEANNTGKDEPAAEPRRRARLRQVYTRIQRDKDKEGQGRGADRGPRGGKEAWRLTNGERHRETQAETERNRPAPKVRGVGVR